MVFRSVRRPACDERAFVLTAVLIDNEIIEEPGGFALCVSQRQAAHAAYHLHQYDEERRRPRPRLPALVQFPHAWRGAVAYCVVVMLVALAAASHVFARDLFDVGAVRGGMLPAGQWWRAFTALTLHWDLEHLLGNLGGGALFGYFAARQLGNGRAWLLVLLAAGAANLIEVTLVAGNFISAGASTAVFATVGLLAAHTWRTRRGFGLPGWRQAAPLIGGLLLLAWLGTEGEHTDVLSHGLGFGCGALTGIAAASRPGTRLLERISQPASAIVVLAWLSLCWWLALA
ncbi:MAG TPA: rhomboid family intramembrane serine protease [Steroidobacteraceae bacterium]|nr:rhomboid family intramembrane serine protease [Steroidobacteraceae bacterium]